MRFQLFGSKNVSTAAELRTVGQRKKEYRKNDDWGIDPVSAMRVPIISSSRSTSLASNAVAKQTSKPLIKKHLKLVDTASPLRKKLGIYSSSKAYCSYLTTQINATDIEIFSFANDMVSSEFRFEDASIMDAWLIHMAEEDESPWLECILDLGAKASSLFLFEPSLTSQCLNKIQDFMLETKQAV
tara:strand:+ start:79258 stop:79812 length:555 start_codon:yes stop_codon:yes gene_type:complete